MEEKSGILLIDKTKGCSSFDVVRDVRRFLDIKKVGHSGTLDPLATGLMMIAFGDGTKVLEYLLGFDKEYEVVAEFGSFSDTYDADGEISIYSDEVVFKDTIESEISLMYLGEIDQIPPKYSALKICGKRACDMMREGKEVYVSPRKVRIDAFEILEYKWPLVKFRVACSKGTYIRSLINDLGKNLGTAAYVKELRRTRIGDFSVENACIVKELSNKFDQCMMNLDQFVPDYFKTYELSDFELAILNKTGVLNSILTDEPLPLLAMFEGKFMGVLDKSSEDGIRLKKRTN